MKHITKIAAVETTTAIWEYDPTLSDNRLLNGSLDVIAAIRTLAIKACGNRTPSLTTSHFQQIQSSGQRIEVFNKLQLECNFDTPFKIPLHSNVRWGTAYRMLERGFKLREVCNTFYSVIVPW
jgi:spore coat protein U-like protein